MPFSEISKRSERSYCQKNFGVDLVTFKGDRDPITAFRDFRVTPFLRVSKVLYEGLCYDQALRCLKRSKKACSTW
jgi:hypothetical protein